MNDNTSPAPARLSNGDRFLSVPQLQELLSLSRSPAYRLIHRVGPTRIGGILRVSERRLLAYLDAQTEDPSVSKR
jgi:hypothetical protein